MKISRYFFILLMSLLTISVAAQPMEQRGQSSSSLEFCRVATKEAVRQPRGQRNRRPPRQHNEQRPPMEVDSAFAALFEEHSQMYHGTDLKYRVAAIGDVEGQSPMLVVYLHGRSASGNDNLKQLAKEGVRFLYGFLKKNGSSAYLLVPQCPEGRRWNEREKDGWQMSAVVKQVLDDFIKSHGVDPGQVFIFGDSMGGAGVFRMLNDYKDYFAAAMIAAAVPRGVSAGKLAKTPLCYVLGSDDEMVYGNKDSQKMVKSLQKKKADLRYELLEGKTHQQTCHEAFTDENIEWVLSHTR